MKAMILAAGLGTRLLPYTLKRPKPLFPILNKPLLGLTINRIRLAGFSEIVVNAHHLADQIMESMASEKDIFLQEEEKVLGTGGGLRRALSSFDHDPVLVVNGDIYHSISYRDVYRFHKQNKADVTLVLHDLPRFNSVSVEATGMITGFAPQLPAAEPDGKLLAFTGIHVINPEVLKTIAIDTVSCIVDCYRKLLQQGGSIRAFSAAGHFWTDMGTPADYLKLHEDLLNKRIPVYEELVETVAAGPFAGLNNLAPDSKVKVLDWVSIGNRVTVGSGVTLQRSVIWDDATVAAKSLIRDAIVTP